MYNKVAAILLIYAFKACIRSTNGTPGCIETKLNKLDEKLCKGGFIWSCRNLNLQKVPKIFPNSNASLLLCGLDLSWNNLTTIQDNAFDTLTDLKWLWLNENNLAKLESHAFVGLRNLHYLNLSSNRLEYPNSFENHVFDPLKALQQVNLKNNSISTYDGLENLLSPLRSLTGLQISGCYNCTFGKGFEDFAKLTSLSLAGTWESETCYIHTLLNETFIHMPKLANLYISFCNISNVEPGALSPLRNIINLDISYNPMLRFEGMKHVLFGLANSSIRILDVSAIHEPFERGTKLRKSFIEPIQYLKELRVLIMELNKLEVISEKVFDLIPKSTSHFMLAGNRLTYGKYVNKLYNMNHLVTLDLSRQHLNYDPFLQRKIQRYTPQAMVNMYTCATQTHAVNSGIEVSKHDDNNRSSLMYEDIWETTYVMNSPEYIESNWSCDLWKNRTCPKNTTCICAPENLKILLWRASFVYVHIFSLRVWPWNRLCAINLSFNLLEKWIGPVYGLEKLKELNLAENICYNMSSYFFDNFHDLENLNVSFNVLGRSLDPTRSDAGKHFKNLKQLKMLDLTQNGIESLSVDLFENLEILQELYVGRNFLTEWNSTLKTKCLRLLDLSNNKLESLREPVRNYLDGIAELPPEQTCNRTELLTVRLSGNPIRCNCDNRDFLRWLSKSQVLVRFYNTDECHLKDGSRLPLSNPDVIPAAVDHLDAECVPYVWIGVSLGIFIVSIGLYVTVYFYRWRLRHFYYSLRRRHQHKGYDRLFECDAFISYAKTEAGFIKDKLVPSLEEDHGLKLWVADRDALAGASIAENLTHAIYSSKKSVLLLSKRYFLESWCNYEMNMARVESVESQRKLIIIVLYDDISSKEMPLDYLRLLRTVQHIEYPKHPQHHETFWASLAEAIKQV